MHLDHKLRLRLCHARGIQKGGFTLKTHQMLSVHASSGNLKMQQSQEMVVTKMDTLESGWTHYVY